VNDLFRLLRLEDPNTRVVLIGSGLLGLASGIIGSFAVLRRRSLVGDAVSHAALPGICVGYLVVGDRNFAALLLGALVFGLLGVVCIGAIRAWTRTREDAAIGIVLSTFFGGGLVLSRLIQGTPGGNKAGLDGFIFGKAAAMVRADVALIIAAAAAIIVVVALLFKELSLLCFDRDYAASIGRPVVWMDVAMMGLVCVCVIVGLPAVGAVLSAALLIIPAAAARFWTDRLWRMVAVAGAMGFASAVLGSALSAVVPAPPGALSRGWPTGPVIVLAAGALFLFSMLFAPARGVIAEAVRRRRMRRRISLHHFLREIYELEEELGRPALVAPGVFSGGDVSSASSFRRAARRALRRGYVSQVPPDAAPASGAASDSAPPAHAPGSLVLTDLGRAEASRIVRAHRLWELFLINQADIAPDHVHRDADELEHILTHDMVQELERELHESGKLPYVQHSGAVGADPALRSPHPIGRMT